MEAVHDKQNKRKRARKLVFAFVLLSILVMIIFTAIYLSDYYRADENALRFLENSEQVSVTSEKNMTVFRPQSAPDSDDQTIGFIFYPGGKVDEKAYAPLLYNLTRQGVTSVLVHMPFRLAVLRSNAADSVMASVSDIDVWYIGGHSLGGAMAASYAARKPHKLEGVVLLAAYTPSDLSQTDLKMLSVYGSEDLILSIDRYQNSRDFLPAEFSENRIIGGNHAYFADYGEQAGDGIALVSRQEQQSKTISLITNFIK